MSAGLEQGDAVSRPTVLGALAVLAALALLVIPAATADTPAPASVTVAGSLQSELGCPGDWDPGCFKSWLEDIDGDGTYTLTTSAIPAGHYEFKAALNGSWDVNYGAGGASGGGNLALEVPDGGGSYVFTWDPVTHIPSVEPAP